MPEPVKKPKKCPNCEKELILDEAKPNEAYCGECDITYHLHKGKVHYEAGNKKGKIQELEEKLAEHEITFQKVLKKLFGEDEQGRVKDFWEV